MSASCTDYKILRHLQRNDATLRSPSIQCRYDSSNYDDDGDDIMTSLWRQVA